jgi:hypothetical protein
VQLLPCKRPVGPLESAPRTSLREDSAQERWEGFWSTVDEGYYARCTTPDGAENWYRVADESRRRGREVRVIPLRRALTHRSDGTRTITTSRMLYVARERQRPILIGTSRRTPRVTRGTGGAF